MNDDYAFLIPAGGVGSRVYPLTKEFPKPYLPIYISNDNEVIRLIDLPLMFCKKNNIPVYIALDYQKEKLKYLEDLDNVRVIYTNYDQLSEAILALLKDASLDDIHYYSVYAADFLIPTEIMKKMINLINSSTETVALCSRDNDYSKIKLKSDRGRLSYSKGEEVTDLTFHIGMVDKGIDCMRSLIDKDVTSMWDYLYPRDEEKETVKARLLVSDVNHIDAGLPESYYEAVYKLNSDRVDGNGNIIFPGAKINCESKNVIALPNSDSSNIVLENCVVPENALVNDYNDVLSVDTDKKEYFGKIKIKDFI